MAGRINLAPAYFARKLGRMIDDRIEYRRLRREMRGLPPVALPRGLLIVIVVFNGYLISRACLRSVLRHTSPPFRLIVVDNGSSGATKAWLSRLRHPHVTVVRSETNLGVPKERNLGLAAASLHDYDAVAFLDNDVTVGPGWYVPFVWHLQCLPDLGIVGDRGVVIGIVQ